MPEDFVPVCRVEELAPGEMRAVEVAGRRVLVANVGGVFYAIGAVCTHAGGYLDEGYAEGDTVVCPIHFARYSLRTGEVSEGPAPAPVPCFAVRVVDGMVCVQAPGERFQDRAGP